VLLSSIRRSLFNDDPEREKYLGMLMDAIRDILDHGQGLSVQDNHHEFCRILARLKANYQLNQIVANANYVDFITKIFNFSISSIKMWEVNYLFILLNH
jgi:exportin-7